MPEPMRGVAALLLAVCSWPSPARSAPPAAPAEQQLVLENVATGLTQPTDVGFLPDGRMVIVEKGGAVKLRSASGAISLAGGFPVDARSEKGLLGVAVDPDFASTRRLFFYYSRAGGVADPGTDADRHRVVSIQLGAGGTLDAATEKVLVRGLRGPANHDGGALAFGPADGKLYVGVGDTGCNSGRKPETQYPPTNHFATCLTNGNGKILRVNLDGSIPRDNPLVSVPLATACPATCGEAPSGLAAPRADLWAWGFRNPWRFAFDPRTGRLWVGDVGEVTYEEVTIAQRGRHHGWPWREGARGWPTSKCAETVPGDDCVDPVYFCRHGAAADGIDGECQSITGGVFLDGAPWPAAWQGLYLFGDNANGRLWTLQLDTPRSGVVPASRRQVGSIPGGPVSFRMGPDNLAYVVALAGRVVRISPPR